MGYFLASATLRNPNLQRLLHLDLKQYVGPAGSECKVDFTPSMLIGARHAHKR